MYVRMVFLAFVFAPERISRDEKILINSLYFFLDIFNYMKFSQLHLSQIDQNRNEHHP